MVTAVVIPIICLYFYWLTRKEMKEQDKRWLSTANVKQESVLVGQIKEISEEKQRYYYHRYIYVQDLKLQTKTRLITVKKVTPLTKNTSMEVFTIGEKIRVYGSWDGSHFIFSHYERDRVASTH